jgi:hypothetical protein
MTRDSPALGLWAWLGERDCWRGCTAAQPDGVRLELASSELLAGQKGGGAARLQQSREARVRGAGDCGIDRGQGVVAAGANTTSTACSQEGTGHGRFYSGAILLPLRRSKGQA